MAKKLAFFFLVIVILLCFWQSQSKTVFAASLTGVSDTVTTSRPSASTPVVNNVATSDTQETIFDNNSVFLASDSATLYLDPNGGGESTDNSINIASMSAANTPSAGQRIAYFTNSPGHAHHKGDALAVPITAMHTVQFTVQTPILSGGKIIITFPTSNSSDTNQASPSASTFMFNGLTNTNIKVNFSAGATTCTTLVVSGTSAGSAPTITCTTATATVNTATVVTFLIGCSANTGAACTTQVPTLINPTRVATDTLAGEGVATTQADNWKVNIQTQDPSSVVEDTARALVGTIESVQVQANIDPTLTFTIAGIANGTNINSGHGTSCPSESTNTGIGTNATFVNMGTVGTPISIAAQDITISTNGLGGYSLTATSSGQMFDAQNGYKVNSSTTPGYVTAGTELFGVHPCGSDATSSFNPNGQVCHGGTCASGAGSGSDGKVAWPTATTALTLASHNTTANAIITTIEYALTASNTTPAGLYEGVITYVATPTFN